MALTSRPEGAHNVVDIEVDGDEMFGRTAGRHSVDWAAEIQDEREEESFAWQSHEGSDCAGLATFHELSDRLTRVELNLDVVPTSVPETFQLALHLADRRAETELRRFKARVELINPDLYEDEEEDRDEDEGADEPQDLDQDEIGDEPEDVDEPEDEDEDFDGPDDADDREDPDQGFQDEDQPQDDLDEQRVRDKAA